jgi:hypothetical protein
VTGPARSWPDVEDVLVGLLDAAGLADNAGRDLPANLRYRMPFVLVRRRGGTDDGRTDRAMVDVDVLSSQPGVAKTRSADIRDHLLGDPLLLWPIDYVETVSGPQEIPHGDTSVLRWTTTYEVHCRRVVAS